MPTAPPSSRTQVRRLPKRGVYELDEIRAILDEALVCQVGFVDAGQPYVLPTIHGRIGDRLYLHGARKNRMLQVLAGGAPACVSVTIVDGLVLARSAFHHSMNYRSVVVLGEGIEVVDPDEKLEALRAIVDRVAPGRWATSRPPTDAELRSTTVVGLPIDEASAKVRTGPPNDDESDLDYPVWAGVVPLHLASGAPVPAPDLLPGLPPPSAP